MSESEVPAHVLQFLRDHNVMTVATANSSGIPHAATMMFVNDGPNLYFCTRPDTTTAAHVEQNPVIAFTVDDYQSDWRSIRGVQGSGQVFVVLSPDAISAAMDLFAAKFPALSDMRARNLSVFRVVPTSIQYVESQQADGSMQALARDWQRTMVYSVFRELPSRQAEDLIESLTPLHVDAGEVIVRQGAPADKFFIIADGEVEVTREDAGVERHIANLKTGQFFGEMAVLRDQPRNATVRSVVSTSLLVMPAETFRGIVAQSLSTTANFDRVIETRFAELAAGTGGTQS